MLYVQLDVNWVDNPKVMEVGLDGAGLHAAAMCIAKRMETDGVLHRTHLRRVGGSDELIDRLVDHELLDVVDDRRVRVHDWLDRNKSQQEIANGRTAIAATRSARSASGREGNHRRWGHPGTVEDCPKCSPPTDPEIGPNTAETPWSVAGATRNESHSDSHPIASDSQGDRKLSLETESETEEETETNTPVETANDDDRSLRLVEPTSSPPATARRSKAQNVQAVFDAWRESTGHPGAKLDGNRKRLIEQRLKDYPVEDLVDAVRGWRHSPHHRGENERHRTYNDLGLLLRNGEKVEFFRDLERHPATRPPKAGKAAAPSRETGGAFPSAEFS